MTPSAMPSTVGISGLGYRLADATLSVEELERAGLLTSPAATLQSMGFERAHVAKSDEERSDLAVSAARSVLEEGGIDPKSVDVMIFFGALDPDPPPNRDGLLIDRFRYPASRVQHELGLTRAVAFGVGQQGCASLATALRLSRALVRSGDARRVLCVGADVVPDGYRREVIYNILSDGACAVLVDADEQRLQPVAFRQVTKGYYWDSASRRTEIVAAYYPTARTVVNDALETAGLTTADVALFIPDNISLQSWKVLLELIDIDENRAYLDNIAAHGHFVSADNVVNLKDALAVRPLDAGDTIVLFTFGFGANWSATVLRA